MKLSFHQLIFILPAISCGFAGFGAGIVFGPDIEGQHDFVVHHQVILPSAMEQMLNREELEHFKTDDMPLMGFRKKLILILKCTKTNKIK